MIKVHVYSYKTESLTKWASLAKPPYNLSIIDVDWDAKPEVFDLINYGYGPHTVYREKIEWIPICRVEGETFVRTTKPVSFVDIVETQILKAFVTDKNGFVREFPAYTVREIK